MSSPSDTEPSVPTVPDVSESTSELKTVSFKLFNEGRLGFYLPTDDKDEMLRLFKNKMSKLAPNAKYLGPRGSSLVEINDADTLAEIVREQPTLFITVCDADHSGNLPNSWSERFYRAGKQKSCARNQNNRKHNCCHSKVEVGPMLDSCPCHAYHSDYYFGSTFCDPYHAYPSSFCCQEPFPLMYPHCSVYGYDCGYGDYGSRCKRCPLYYY
ncbi:hypothetical protein KIN20_014043 [Parelaphostrongylus tenuis]|uniref:Uncharacterized protein n=1 Tax=Parelaphostrongylus tenuis TaxID=148309 RepID=A0AAD5MHQ2_PARTN|nr:hypothetical protein KIN20_014043 [Parelaphostrongylus tenuis]